MRFTVGLTLIGAVVAAFLAVGGVLGGGWYFSTRENAALEASNTRLTAAVTLYQEADRERRRLEKVDTSVKEEHTKAVKAIIKENTNGLQKSVVALEANRPWADARVPSDVLDSLR